MSSCSEYFDLIEVDQATCLTKVREGMNLNYLFEDKIDMKQIFCNGVITISWAIDALYACK